jgi:hypothetical protein
MSGLARDLWCFVGGRAVETYVMLLHCLGWPMIEITDS